MSGLFDYIGVLYSNDKVQSFIENNALIKKDGEMGEELYISSDDEKLTVLIENESIFVSDLYRNIDFEKDDFVLTVIFVEDYYIKKFDFPKNKDGFIDKYGDFSEYDDVCDSFDWYFEEKMMSVNFKDDETKSVQLQFRKNIML